jgi:hypothetical protein
MGALGEPWFDPALAFRVLRSGGIWRIYAGDAFGKAASFQHEIFAAAQLAVQQRR